MGLMEGKFTDEFKQALLDNKSPVVRIVNGEPRVFFDSLTLKLEDGKATLRLHSGGMAIKVYQYPYSAEDSAKGATLEISIAGFEISQALRIGS